MITLRIKWSAARKAVGLWPFLDVICFRVSHRHLSFCDMLSLNSKYLYMDMAGGVWYLEYRNLVSIHKHMPQTKILILLAIVIHRYKHDSFRIQDTDTCAFSLIQSPDMPYWLTKQTFHTPSIIDASFYAPLIQVSWIKIYLRFSSSFCNFRAAPYSRKWSRYKHVDSPQDDRLGLSILSTCLSIQMI